VSWPYSLRFPLSRWISVRILALAIGTAVVVATCMWLRFAIWNATVMRRMPEADRAELKYLVAHPNRDSYRLVQLINQYYGVTYVYPEIGNVDWLTLGVLLVGAVPAIVLVAWRMSRPVSQQFLHVAHAARQVARGDFSTRAPLLPHVPQEFTELALDFNEMTARPQSYEREVRDSSANIGARASHAPERRDGSSARHDRWRVSSRSGAATDRHAPTRLAQSPGR
jgi:two-component system sensor histidine kinase AdeS